MSSETNLAKKVNFPVFSQVGGTCYANTAVAALKICSELNDKFFDHIPVLQKAIEMFGDGGGQPGQLKDEFSRQFS